MRILLLEDDIDYKETIHEFLDSLGYQVESFENGDEALNAIHFQSYQLLLLDIRVPGTNGYEIVKSIREMGNEIPVIFMTSLTDIDNLSIGYELGCNDYIRKPFASKELQYRIEQVLKLFYFHSNAQKISLVDGYFYDMKSGKLLLGEDVISLTVKEQKVWDYLIANIGEYIPTKQLWEDVWECKMVTQADIRMCIKKIRDKTSSKLISNQKGLGYRVDKKR
ncbi:response regulator transcription factor [Sulfurimonas sp.]|uniref:response regulator transcription factor n=1 Tax=Sulfurimonas sp. TaxID=2022749 RepID=UPI00261BB614|nr:response regulator transcription factor [Sulfurimonas sp.]